MFEWICQGTSLLSLGIRVSFVGKIPIGNVALNEKQVGEFSSIVSKMSIR